MVIGAACEIPLSVIWTEQTQVQIAVVHVAVVDAKMFPKVGFIESYVNDSPWPDKNTLRSSTRT